MKLYGFLFSWLGFSKDYVGSESKSMTFEAALGEVPQLTNITGRQGVQKASPLPKNWRLVNFRSHEALAGESDEKRASLDGDDYSYDLYVRLNPQAGTVIFASKRYKITEAAVKTFHTRDLPKLVRREIRVPELAKRLLLRGASTEYFVTFLNTNVPGFGESLNSMSLEGEDIAGAGFFRLEETRDNLAHPGLSYSNFTARRIGLRPIDSRHEFGRFGTDNRMEFSDELLSELEDFLNYVKV